MKKKSLITRVALSVFLATTLLAASTNARAAVSPVALSLFAPVQLPPTDFTVTGVRLSALVGKHRKVYFLDLAGIGNITEQQFGGVAAIAGGFNWNQGQTTITGIQVAGLMNANIDKASIYGLQATLGVNYNKAESRVVGFQIAAISNYSPYTKVVGMQVGLYNRARHMYGFQIGLVNDCEKLHGIQLGLLNFNRKGLFSMVPFLNIDF